MDTKDMIVEVVYENKDGTLSIYDWKRVKSIDKFSHFNKFAKAKCISNIQDTNYWHYSIQLNMYKYILENNYGIVIRDLYLVRLHPNNTRKSFDLIKVPILTTDIEILCKFRIGTWIEEKDNVEEYQISA